MPYPVNTTHFKLKKDSLNRYLASLDLSYMVKVRVSSILSEIQGKYDSTSFFKSDPVQTKISAAMDQLTALKDKGLTTSDPNIEKIAELIDYLKQSIEQFIEKEVTTECVPNALIKN
jgi:hypothetical protein